MAPRRKARGRSLQLGTMGGAHSKSRRTSSASGVETIEARLEKRKYALMDLPVDLIMQHILPHLTLEDLGHVVLASRRLREIAEQADAAWAGAFAKKFGGNVNSDVVLKRAAELAGGWRALCRARRDRHMEQKAIADSLRSHACPPSDSDVRSMAEAAGGGLAAHLRASDRALKACAAPTEVLFLIDTSSSVQNVDFKNMCSFAAASIRAAASSEVAVSVALFDESVHWWLLRQPATDAAADFVMKIERQHGGTDIRGALVQAREVLQGRLVPKLCTLTDDDDDGGSGNHPSLDSSPSTSEGGSPAGTPASTSRFSAAQESAPQLRHVVLMSDGQVHYVNAQSVLHAAKELVKELPGTSIFTIGVRLQTCVEAGILEDLARVSSSTQGLSSPFAEAQRFLSLTGSIANVW
ncbi:unnamed protein product [Pedinophyceae sp. YPF-701]|nr:unnamed protein product [Pedinophyceae sp. YPF-701]